MAAGNLTATARRQAPPSGLSWREATRSVRGAQVRFRAELPVPLDAVNRWLRNRDAAQELRCGHLPCERCCATTAAAAGARS
jgi:hypothetical protein